MKVFLSSSRMVGSRCSISNSSLRCSNFLSRVDLDWASMVDLDLIQDFIASLSFFFNFFLPDIDGGAIYPLVPIRLNDAESGRGKQPKGVEAEGNKSKV